jgi:hypothetical protein
MTTYQLTEAVRLPQSDSGQGTGHMQDRLNQRFTLVDDGRKNLVLELYLCVLLTSIEKESNTFSGSDDPPFSISDSFHARFSAELRKVIPVRS